MIESTAEGTPFLEPLGADLPPGFYDYRPLLRVPWLDQGDTLEGWDCWGCCRHVALDLGLRPPPDPRADPPARSQGYAQTEGLQRLATGKNSWRALRALGDLLVSDPRRGEGPLHVSIVVGLDPLSVLSAGLGGTHMTRAQLVRPQVAAYRMAQAQ